MGEKTEKSLAILLVSMVLFMVLQTVCIIHVDKRIDRLDMQQRKTQSAIDGWSNECCPKERGIYVAKTNGTLAPLDVPEDAKESSDGLGYEFELMCRVITAEGGTDREVCMGVAQALYNACEKHEWLYSPTEMLGKYRYTSPADWVSDEAKDACVEIFLNGNTYDPVGNATVFYAPKYCDSLWHESQNFICEISGVRFFSENG
jgi:hypothetical protein